MFFLTVLVKNLRWIFGEASTARSFEELVQRAGDGSRGEGLWEDESDEFRVLRFWRFRGAVRVAMGSSSTIWRRKQVKQASRGGIQLAKHLRVAELVSIGSAAPAPPLTEIEVLLALAEHNGHHTRG